MKNFREASPKIVPPTMKTHRGGSSDIEKIEMDLYNPRKNARQQTAKICLPIPKSHFLCSEPGFCSTEKNNERFRFSNGRALPNERKNRETIAIVSRSAPFFGHFAISAKPSSRKKNRPCEVFSAFQHRSAGRTDIRDPYKYRTRAKIRRYIFRGWNADS